MITDCRIRRGRRRRSRSKQALEGEPAAQGRLRAGIGNLDRRGARRAGDGRSGPKTDAIFVVDAITGLGTMPLDIDGWGLDVVIGGSQKAFMIPPGLAFHVGQPEGVEVRRDVEAAALLLQPEEGKEERRRRRIELDARLRR